MEFRLIKTALTFRRRHPAMELVRERLPILGSEVCRSPGDPCPNLAGLIGWSGLRVVEGARPRRVPVGRPVYRWFDGTCRNRYGDLGLNLCNWALHQNRLAELTSNDYELASVHHWVSGDQREHVTHCRAEFTKVFWCRVVDVGLRIGIKGGQ